ncbi:DUF2637 domain-containing protein [Actinoplanes sp. NPDC051633]|uniref:DUF2637 domain-containing protein n=1 Tax=Actinoplanes sp. NPDC051633 TaxID=3155670 RepID=UPI003439A0A8
MTPATAPTPAQQGNDEHDMPLRRLRWAVRAVLVLGVTASIAANVLHALPNLISQLIAAWPPLALLLTVELISRVPTHRRDLAALRLIATAIIAGIAAWVSYWHMAGVAARYGETGAAASYLLPLSVDGLVVVASISLVEISGRIQLAEPQATTSSIRAPSQPSSAAPPASPVPTPSPSHGEPATGPGLTARPAGVPSSALPFGQPAQKHPAEGNATATRPTPQRRRAPTGGTDARLHLSPAASRGTATGQRPADTDDRRLQSRTAAAVAAWHRRDPSLHPAEIAQRIGRSERTVRRYWPPEPATSHSHPVGDIA